MAVDSNFNNVVLLLHCDGPNASTTFIDNAPVPHTVTANSTAQISTAQSKFGGASGLLNGTSDYLSTATTSDFNFGAGDFTFECWIRPSDISSVTVSRRVLAFNEGAGNDETGLYISTTGKLLLSIYYSSTTKLSLAGATTLTTNVWQHIAAVRSGDNYYVFLNGTLDASSTVAGITLPTINRLFSCGYTFNPSFPGRYAGYIDDIRITKGVARYTAAFTPPTIAFPNTDADSNYDNVVLHLPCNGINTSTFFGDTKGNTVTANGNAQITTAQSKWGGSSATFDGTGDSLNVGFVAMDASDFTLEAWVYFDALGAGNRTLFSQYTGADAARTLLDVRNAKLSIFSGANGVQSGATTLTTGQWYHIAYVRQGSTCKGYLNGVLEVTHSTFQTPYSTNMLVGTYTGASGDEFSGKMDDIRVTRGVARYTSAFTPPAGPFPITGVDANFDSVTLLLHGEGTNLTTYVEDASPSTKALTCNGNAKVSDSNFKWGSSCLAFDGTGDYITATITNPLGSGSFTVEAWIYILSLAADNEIFCIGDIANTSAFDFVLEVKTTGAVRGSVQNGAGTAQVDITSAGSVISTGAWYHVAFTLNGTAATLWVNGTSVQTGTFSGSRNTVRTDCRIGRLANAITRDFNGYIDDLRLTTGVARYTAAFTAPVGAFPDSGLLSAPSANLFTKRLLEGIDLSQRAVPVLPLYL